MNRMRADPPRKYRDFVGRFPKLAEAWDAIHEAGATGPLDEKTKRLVKLDIAIGAFKEGATMPVSAKHWIWVSQRRNWSRWWHCPWARLAFRLRWQPPPG